MAHDIRALLGPDGVARVAVLSRRVDRHTVSGWVRSGRLERPHRGVVVDPERSSDWRVQAMAAVLATDGVLSHPSALAVHGLAPIPQPLHVSVAAGRRAARLDRVIVHRVQRLDQQFWRQLPVTSVARALVDSWGLASGRLAPDRGLPTARAAVLDALRERRARPAEVRREIAARPALPGRAALQRLVSMVESGSHSELEIWGVQHVLRAPGMPAFVQQHPVRLAAGTVHLDAAVPELQVAVELDGAAFHGSPDARERDTRRDVALAAIGWVVLRFSYRRMTTDPDGCRRDILAVCRARRSLMHPR